MRAFIQCTVSSNMLEPINPNVFNAYKGLEDMGFECVKFSTLQDLADYYHSRGELIVGGIGIIRKRLKAFDIDPITVDYPEELKEFLGRTIQESTLSNIANNPETWPIFIKSKEQKRIHVNKYLFLDVDGVLNSEAFYTEISQNDRMLKIHEENPSISGQMVYKLSNFDPEAIKRLNKIFKETGCKLIVSSSWRFDSDLKELFKMVGISNEIFGITGISQTRYRGFEIQNYLDAQKNVLSYCILDGDCDMLPTQLDNFIQTDFRVGLTEDNVNKAIKILNRYDEH